MAKLVGAITVLVLAVLHAPQPAQALLYEYFPSTFFDLGASEPVVLVVTAVALLALGRVAASRSQQAPPPEPRHVAAPQPIRPARRLPRRMGTARRVA